MNVSEIMVSNVISLTSEDTVAKALAAMVDHSINQVPITDQEKYLGMVFAKQFVWSNPVTSSKLKGFVVNTPVLSESDTVDHAARMIIGSGNRALPVVGKGGKIVGMVSETDIVLTADFGRATVDEVMSGAIVIEEDTTLADAIAKMRRYNISRLPVINTKGVLKGTINPLDVGKIFTTPRERTSKSAGISGMTASIKEVKVKDIVRRAFAVERGTKINSLIGNFKNNEEIVVVGDSRAMGVVTPKDVLELLLPKSRGPTIQIAHIEDGEARAEIQEQMTRFLKKIQGKLENVTSVVVYADKHKTRKYSLRTRLITTTGIVEAKAVGYDPISASKELISRLERRIKSEHSQKVKDRQHRESARRS